MNKHFIKSAHSLVETKKFIFCLMGALALPVWAQEESTPTPVPSSNAGAAAPGVVAIPLPAIPGDANAQNPSQIQSWRLDVGYLLNRIKNEKDQLYYRVEYKGKPLKEKGTPLSFVNLNRRVEDLPKSEAADAGGDSSQFEILLKRGHTKSTGAIADLFGARELKLPGVFKQLRGAARLSGELDGKPLNLALGLETPPLHPLAPINKTTKAGITNWLIFGLAGQTPLSKPDNASDDDNAIATYRAFVGRGFGWVRSQRLEEVAVDQVLDRAPTYEAALEESPRILQTSVQSGKVPPVLDSLIVGLAQRPKPLDWEAEVTAQLKRLQAPADQPTSALWLEGAGWYNLSGTSQSGKDWNNMITATATYWLDPKQKGNQWISLRYEVGRDRAQQTERRNFGALSFGLNF